MAEKEAFKKGASEGCTFLEETEPMKRVLVCLLFLLPLLQVGCKERVKPPSVAGSFYPADPDTLDQMVTEFIQSAEKINVEGRLYALLCPHAGYQFSGSVAGYCYRQIKDRPYRTVILIGPSHYSSFRGVSVYSEGSLLTPLGKVRINEAVAKSLLNKEADIRFFPEAFEKEHSLEVQLPFLQKSLKDFTVVPLLIGAPSKKSYEYLVTKLTELIREDEKTLIIVSSDLSHYHDYETAKVMDHRVIDAIERMALEELQSLLASGRAEMCGAYPMMYAMGVLRMVGATNGVLFRYANSGDVTGDRSRVVGYAAVGIFRTPLTEAQKRLLLDIARKTVITYVKEGKEPQIEVNDPRLRANGATFVTIKTGSGRLRGCIGNIVPYMPLYRSVIVNAINASSRDPRFPPMRPEELEDIEIEVTVLSPLQPLRDVDDIKIGRDGLYIVKGGHSGLLLPQVALEFNWDRETFLKELCYKAGLPPDAWKEAKLYRFTADIISE
jgi:hypothetical protein